MVTRKSGHVINISSIAGIVIALGMVWFVKLLYLDVMISPLGTAYIYTTSTARVNYAMSKNGYMPEIIRNLSKHGSPRIAILTNFFGGIHQIKFGWDFFVIAIFSVIIFYSAIISRQREFNDEEFKIRR